MAQLWTIASTVTGEVLAVSFETESAGIHPRCRGWPWDGDTQKATKIDAMPSPAIERWTGTVWVPDLDALRAARWVRVKAARDAAEWGGCATALGRVDTDRDSQRKISGSVQMAQIALGAGEPFSVDWTMLDNSVATHDGPAMIAMGIAVGRHVATCHEVAVGKRAAIEAGDDVAAIEAVEIEAGWPA